MANVTVYNMEGKEVGTIELNDAVFGVEINEHLVHMAVVNQLANNRQGTQKAKTRSEVSGGGRKHWRQNRRGCWHCWRRQKMWKISLPLKIACQMSAMNWKITNDRSGY